MTFTKLLDEVARHLDMQRLLLVPDPDDQDHSHLRADLAASAKALESEVRRLQEDRTGILSILVAVDDSEQAQWAIEQAVHLAERVGARVSLVHVVDVAPSLAPEVALADPLDRESLLNAASRLLGKKAAHIPAELLGQEIICEGSAPKQIIATARQIGADLIVIGTHGRGLIGRFLLGSVAAAVVRNAPCPVLSIGDPGNSPPPEPYAVEYQESAAVAS